MALEAVKSSTITNADATPRVPNNPALSGGELRSSRGYCSVTNAADIASTYRFARVRSNAVVDTVAISNTAITTCAGDVGLYKTAADGGAVVDADFFGSAVSLATAGSNVDVTHEASGTGFGDLSKCEMPLWQALGLSADPNIEYDVAVTLTAAAGSAGKILGVCKFAI